MVRGLAAVLGLAVVQAYFLVADELPAIGGADTALMVAGGIGVALATFCAVAAAPVSDERPLVWLVALGGGLVVTTLNAADAGAAATPAEAVTYSAAGAAFATALLTPALALVLPIFVALVDGGSALLGDAAEPLARTGQPETGDALSLELPDWGTGLAAGKLGIAEVVFAGVFLVYARRFGLRPFATAVAMAVALAGSVVAEVQLDTTIPALPVLAAAYLLVNADRLGGLIARSAESD